MQNIMLCFPHQIDGKCDIGFRQRHLCCIHIMVSEIAIARVWWNALEVKGSLRRNAQPYDHYWFNHVAFHQGVHDLRDHMKAIFTKKPDPWIWFLKEHPEARIQYHGEVANMQWKWVHRGASHQYDVEDTVEVWSWKASNRIGVAACSFNDGNSRRAATFAFYVLAINRLI